MGCDIHICLERKIKGEWHLWRQTDSGPSGHRNYERFWQLAGVRCGNGPEGKALGLPDDAGPATALLREEWAADGHSTSYMGLDMAVEVFRATEMHQAGHMMRYANNYPHEHYFDVDAVDGEDPSQYRIVFWFDN